MEEKGNKLQERQERRVPSFRTEWADTHDRYRPCVEKDSIFTEHTGKHFERTDMNNQARGKKAGQYYFAQKI